MKSVNDFGPRLLIATTFPVIDVDDLALQDEEPPTAARQFSRKTMDNLRIILIDRSLSLGLGIPPGRTSIALKYSC